jgi:hypothetical protein
MLPFYKISEKNVPMYINTKLQENAIKTWTDVILLGNDTFVPGDCYGNNSSVLSKSV